MQLRSHTVSLLFICGQEGRTTAAAASLSARKTQATVQAATTGEAER